MNDRDKLAMRKRARQSAKRFTEEEFAKGWISQMERLVELAGGGGKELVRGP